MQNLRQGTADGWRKHDGGAQSHAHGGVLAHAVAAVGRPPPPQRAVLLTPHCSHVIAHPRRVSSNRRQFLVANLPLRFAV